MFRHQAHIHSSVLKSFCYIYINTKINRMISQVFSTDLPFFILKSTRFSKHLCTRLAAVKPSPPPNVLPRPPNAAVSHPPPPRMHRHRLLPAARRRQSLSRLWGSWVIEPECMNTSVCMYVRMYIYIYIGKSCIEQIIYTNLFILPIH